MTLGGDFYILRALGRGAVGGSSDSVSPAGGHECKASKNYVVFAQFPHFRNFRGLHVSISRHACRVLATLGLFVLAGCASTTQPGVTAAAPAASVTSPEARQDLVRRRALSRWDLLIKDDMDAAYAYMSPGSSETTSLEKYKTNFRRGAFREARWTAVTCDGDACVARIYVTYDHPKDEGHHHARRGVVDNRRRASLVRLWRALNIVKVSLF